MSKTKQYLKKNDFLLLSLGANQNSQNWMLIQQGLHKVNLNYYKVGNNTAIKIIENSIYMNYVNSMSSTFFFLKPSKHNTTLTKSSLIYVLNSLFFTVLIIKLDKNFYTVAQTKKIKSFVYKENLSSMYQFLLVNLETSVRIKQKN